MVAKSKHPIYKRWKSMKHRVNDKSKAKYYKDKGIKVFNGLDMFIYQGQKSFYLWNKINPEIDDDLINLLLSNLK